MNSKIGNTETKMQHLENDDFSSFGYYFYAYMAKASSGELKFAAMHHREKV